MGKRLGQAAIVGAGAAIVALILWTSGFLKLWEFAAWRWRVDYFAEPGAASPKIKLILLDQRSLDWGEKENGWTWPWPREVYAPIIDYCLRGGAKAVVFDMFFTEPSIYGVDDDRALGQAIDRAPVFVAPLLLSRIAGEAKRWPPHIPVRFPLKIDQLNDWLAGLAPQARKRVVLPRAKFPIPEISTGSAILAGVAQDPEMDGIFRRAHLFKIFDGHVIASLGMAAFLAGEEIRRIGSYSDANSYADISLHELEIDDDRLEAAGRAISLDASGKVILRFRGPNAYQTFGAGEVIQSELRLREGKKPVIDDPSVLKDCYVFLGASASGLSDLRPTPLNKIAPGVELHATMLDNFISDDFLRDPPKWFSIMTILALALMSSTLVVFTTKAWQSAVLVGILLPLPGFIGFFAYPLGYWWPILVHEAATAIALTGGVLLNYANEGRRKSFIKQAFKYYLSPEVIEKILEDPSKLELGGEHRELTMLFSDLQGFSSFSEQLDPPALTSLLNDYLSDMTEIILEEGGTLDKYEGDAIIAFWNAPLDQPDHAKRACRAAVRCQRKLEERREELLTRTGTLLLARIGIHTGQVVVGNMGSKTRFNYTILGDAANLASRLEGANKVFKTFTMVSEATWSRTEGEFLGREIGLIQVVGRKTPVRVYELIDFSRTETPRDLEIFDSALKLYYARDWAEALALFEKISNDPVAKIYAKRCRSLLFTPGVPWSEGVWTLKKM